MKKAILMTIVFVMVVSSAVYAKNTREALAENVIRLHILANSNNQNDQDLKLQVRDNILKQFKTEFSASNNIEETRQVLYDNLAEIKRISENVIRENGYNYTVNVYLAKDFFPTKKYADVTLPAGKYEALRVEIGSAEGKNWWCVMYPPLCYADSEDNEIAVKSKERLAELLNKQQYCLITKNTPDVKVKLKIVEVWSNIKAGI